VIRDWRPVLYTEADTDALAAFCQAQPGKAAAVSAEYIRWQHAANPAGLARVGLAKANGSESIVGVKWLVPLKIQAGNEIVLGSHSCYVLVHPDYRRQGIMSTLVAFCEESGRQQGYRFAYGFPNPRSYPGFVGRLGWSDLGEAGLFLRPLNAGRLVTRRLGEGALQRALGAVASAGSRLLCRPHPLPADTATMSVKDVQTTDPALDDFWLRVRGKYPIMVVRDCRFLDWRYRQVPARDYQLRAARQDGQIVATVVLRSTTIEGVACGMVVDLLVEPSQRGRLGGEMLLHQASGRFKQQDLDLAGCLMLPHAEEANLLRRQGYVLCPRALQPQPFHVILRMHNGEPDSRQLLDLRNWFLTMGDFDAI
jgi:GNAT superfamily N-acetyltransferase